jgi:hypothetical protein
MSNDDITRKSAEEKLSKLKSLPFETSVKVFITGMTSNDPKLSNLAALLLKKTLIEDYEMFKLYSPESVSELKKLLFTYINFDKDTKLLQRVGDILAKIYHHQKNLQEIFPIIVNWFSDSLPKAREFSIYMIESLCEMGAIEDKIVESSISEFNSIFNKGNYYIIQA